MDNTKYEDIISSLARVAAFKANGVVSLYGADDTLNKLPKKGKSVQVTLLSDALATVDVYINAYAGVSVPDLAYNVQQNVCKEVENATNFKLKAVNVHVVDVVFEAYYEQEKRA